MKSVWITVFDATTGAHLRSQTVEPAGVRAAIRDGEDYFIGRMPEGMGRMDLSGTLPQPAPLLAFDVVVEPGRIGNVPPGTIAFQPHQTMTIDDGELTFDLELGHPQVVSVLLINPLYETLQVDVPCPG